YRLPRGGHPGSTAGGPAEPHLPAAEVQGAGERELASRPADGARLGYSHRWLHQRRHRAERERRELYSRRSVGKLDLRPGRFVESVRLGSHSGCGGEEPVRRGSPLCEYRAERQRQRRLRRDRGEPDRQDRCGKPAGEDLTERENRLTTLEIALAVDVVLNEPDADYWLAANSPALEREELAIGHLEVPHALRGAQLGGDVPAPGTARANLAALASAGFTMLSLAGNHI